MIEKTHQLNFPELNIPQSELKFALKNRALHVFDPLRKKYVMLTPEEYVRQRFIKWLIEDLHFPASLMANEVAIDLNKTVKRCDTIIYKEDFSPFVIAEYKSPYIKIDNKTFNQIVRYNYILRAPYLILSNGICHYFCEVNLKENTYCFKEEIPDYLKLKNSI